MKKFFNTVLLAAAIAAPAAMVARAEQAVVYQDDSHHDKHEWNRAEDTRYRSYLKEHHKKYRDFKRLNQKEQEDYWNWRHEH